MTSRQIRRAFSVAILAVALVTTAAACSNDDGTTGNSGATTTRGQTATAELPDDVNDADVAFVQGMVPHHEQAIQMSELVIANGDDPTVIALAEQINAAQGPEIDQMNTWLDDWDIDPAGSDGMDGMDGANGMMSDDEMDMMSEAMGADLDRMFLETMIRHHQGAIRMAEVELEEGSNADVLALAQGIIDGQQAEIDQMQSMLEDT
ncbi:MAG TPA: DUF305 domain-containing protein [Ilumatobacteraceae bacterium]|jgi:uncharacterized protein (DUF305 family)|nr:DUF305 domain-containing protein [Microthrixaceae bacterium]HQZ36278.1 DUF305 domain-containing protein [Ilumatobacteraceae bacterium]HRY11265.1 DUF305 domain-containing protein [Candidatus Nanopelagicales bacterium]MCB9376645.1 DUF305 domain-containing protein [Microthrixaceae bacterium]HMR95063.1 DUF305 domain-containing protein [Microthrixaceae bacterium]